MRKELDIFLLSIESFYKRTNNVLLSTIDHIKDFLVIKDNELKTLKKSIINYEENKEDFFDAMDIVYRIKEFHLDFKGIYDINGDLVEAYKIYLRKPEECIKYAKEHIQEIKEDPEFYKANALKDAEEELKKYEETDILDMLIHLENKLSSNIFVNEEYCSFISSFKDILHSFNSLDFSDRESSYSNFCVSNIGDNKLLEEIQKLYSDYKSTGDVIEDLCVEFDWIIDWFDKDDLKKLASIDSKVCFNLMNISNLCRDFLNDMTADNAENLIKDLERLTKEGFELIQ